MKSKPKDTKSIPWACKLIGHSYIIVETQNWGRYYFGDGSAPHFMGWKANKLWCQRCKHRIDDVEEAVSGLVPYGSRQSQSIANKPNSGLTRGEQ